jgi:hypothetical protein
MEHSVDKVDDAPASHLCLQHSCDRSAVAAWDKQLGNVLARKQTVLPDPELDHGATQHDERFVVWDVRRTAVQWVGRRITAQWCDVVEECRRRGVRVHIALEQT